MSDYVFLYQAVQCIILYEISNGKLIVLNILHIHHKISELFLSKLNYYNFTVICRKRKKLFESFEFMRAF